MSTVTHFAVILSKYFLYIVNNFLADVVFSDAATFYFAAHVVAAAMLRNTIKETSCNVPGSIQRNRTFK
jgi:hypothetical protein